MPEPDLIYHHHPPKTEAAPPPRDYRRLVAGAMSVSVWLLVAKVGTILLTASFVGVRIEIGFFLNVIPVFQVDAAGGDLAAIITLSTVAMSATAAALLIAPAVKGGWDRQAVAGRIVGLGLATETFIFELARHLLWQNVLTPEWIWLPAFELMCGAALAVVALHSTRRIAQGSRVPRRWREMKATGPQPVGELRMEADKSEPGTARLRA